MISFKKGNIFDEDVEALVNTVNCVGVMGKGIALQFKKRFSSNYQLYREKCKNNEIKTGTMFVTELNNILNPKYIINFPTKKHWRNKSSIDYIQTGLSDLIQVIRDKNIKSIAIPPLGCGNGGLNWNEVKEIIKKRLNELNDVDIIVFEPNQNFAIDKIKAYKEKPKMTPGRAALIFMIDRYLNGMLDPIISLLEIHKLTYFMQEAGEPLHLNFKKAYYGPYAENLRHVLTYMNGHFIDGFDEKGDKPNSVVFLKKNALQEALAFLEKYKSTKKHCSKVSDLVEGFETPFGLELLATVHWIMKKNNMTDIKEISKLVYDWNDRKKQFSLAQITQAVDIIKNKGWI